MGATSSNPPADYPFSYPGAHPEATCVGYHAPVAGGGGITCAHVAGLQRQKVPSHLIQLHVRVTIRVLLYTIEFVS